MPTKKTAKAVRAKKPAARAKKTAPRRVPG